MNHLTWTVDFKKIFNKAVERYKAGHRTAAEIFSPDEIKALASIGHRPVEVFDFVEDMVQDSSAFDWETVLLIAAVRRDYFLYIQQGKQSKKIISMNEVPSKTDAFHGVVWLPRIIEKARAKLRGEMPDDLMYCCGGDRHFLHEHHIHPADFLRVVWAAHDDKDKIALFVKEHKGGESA